MVAAASVQRGSQTRAFHSPRTPHCPPALAYQTWHRLDEVSRCLILLR